MNIPPLTPPPIGPVQGVTGMLGSLAGMVGDATVGSIAKAAEGAKEFAGKLLGVTGIGGKIEESVSRIRDFTNEQVDALLHGAASAAQATAEFARETLLASANETDASIQRALALAKETLRDLENVPQHASELLEEAEQIKQATLERRDVLKKHAQRFRERRQKLPKVVSQHLVELGMELEEELEQEAVLAQILAEKTEMDSKVLYGKTLTDAKHYGGQMVALTELNAKRAIRLKHEVSGGISSAKSWASEQVQKVGRFKSERATAAHAIGSPADAKNWATQSIEGAHRLASDIQDEAARKPQEVTSFGQARVKEAMDLSQSIQSEIELAKAWSRSQQGTNAQWKRAMRENRKTAETFLEAQSVKVAMKVVQHGAAIGETGKELLEDQKKDTKGELSKEIENLKKEFRGDEKEIGESLGKQSLKDLPETPHRSQDRDISLSIELPADEPEPTEGPLAIPELKLQSRSKPKPAPDDQTKGDKKKQQPAQGSEKAQKEKRPQKETQKSEPKAGAEAGAAAAVGNVGGPANAIPVEVPQASPRSNGAPQEVSVKVKESSPAAGPNTSTGAAPNRSAAEPAKPAPREKEKKEDPAFKPDSKINGGTSVPSLPKKPKTEKIAGSMAGGQEPKAPPADPQKQAQAGATPNSNTVAPPSGKPKDPSEALKPATGGPANALSNMSIAAKPTNKPEEARADGKKVGATVQKKAAGPNQPEDPKQFQEKLSTVAGAGEAPDASTRATLAQHVGFDPSMVRFHRGPVAQAAAMALNADAFTIGHNVYFGKDKFDMTSPKGLGLAAHEITHVGQQLGIKGTKLQFLTKTGGDAMEQEAQEVGERVASNIAYAQAMRVGRYVRTYEPADDEPMTAAVQIKLDRLSMLALKKAGQTLAQNARPMPLRLDEVLVDLSINLETETDDDIVDAWAEAIVSAVEASRPTPEKTVNTQEVMAPATHILQKRLGDPTQAPEIPKPSPEAMAKFAKITASSAEKDMIRKLLIREKLDPVANASKAKQKKEERDDAAAGDHPGHSRPVVHHSGSIHRDDQANLEAILKEVEINSWSDYEKLKKEFGDAFVKKGFNVTNYILDENLRIVLEQKKRYLARDKDDPKSEIRKLKDAAGRLKDAMAPYIARLNQVFGMVTTITMNDLDARDEMLVRQVQKGDLNVKKEDADELSSLRKTWQDVRKKEGNEHVILLGYNFNPTQITEKGDDFGSLELDLFFKIKDVEDNIRFAKGELSESKFLELHPMVAMTKSAMGIRPGEGADKTINEYSEGKANDAALWKYIQAGAAIALAVTAMVATGGLAAVAMVGSAGLSVYSAGQAAQEYAFKSAAVRSSLDQATLLSKDEPALFWLALELIGAGLDIGAAAGAFKTLAGIAKTAVADRKALAELKDAARTAYKNTPGMKITEEQFVERLIETAKKGVQGTEAIGKQYRVIAELLEATSPRAVAILAGDQNAMRALLTEHGNWRGLMGALQNGGDDAAKISSKIHEYRESIVADLKGRGAKPLEGASTDPLSDYDLNVGGEPPPGGWGHGEGPGSQVMKFEKEMADRFGANWSEALNMNFYTDKTQLLSVDKALKMVSGKARDAIMQRITEKSEKLNFAKMLEHGEDEAQVAQLMKDAGVTKYGIEEVKEAGKAAKAKGREALLKEIDEDMKNFDKLPETSSARIQKAEEITAKQMEANFLSKEAYIGPAAVKGGPLSNAEAYQSAMSQLEMISHVIHDSGGDIVRACREYELYKYVNRYLEAARKAKVETAGMDYFEGLALYVYKRNRTAHQATGGMPHINVGDEAVSGVVDEAFLLDQYNQFRGQVKETLPKIKAAAEKNPTGGWTPEMKQPKPNSGLPPKAPEKGATPPPLQPEVPGSPPNAPGLPPSATLPAASAKAMDAAKELDKQKGQKHEGALTPVQSAGFQSSKSGEGLGVFKGNVPGVPNPVLITVISDKEKAKFDMQLSAAIAAEKSGFGPKVHGKIDMGPGKLAFAMDEVQGGFADDYAKDQDPSKQQDNKNDMMRNAKYIGPTTFADVSGFRNGIWENGFYFVGHIEGFVAPDGHWKPVGFYNAAPITADTVQDQARKNHDENFDRLVAFLMQSHMASLKQNPKPK